MLSSNISKPVARGTILLIGIFAMITMTLWMLQEATLLSTDQSSVIAPEQTIDSITAHLELEGR